MIEAGTDEVREAFQFLALVVPSPLSREISFEQGSMIVVTPLASSVTWMVEPD